ncbi:class I SAM-dependent methyltransferase [Nocardiopsis suaedae]|uniref:Class I SAM-dependent methyltransferase n=1 Tax=Nocardiopsis suaedae TaxID=3018444 RepID=A0ABT4THF6_9ACTN|nr:class I SAM-dependent methyltransferase [Nocardiopsis suaedae]MDA2804143.1 class I SAM-dependent methyltransferase [Nocardiopsis suaedae]
MPNQTWDAELYDTRHAFVASLGADLIGLLAPAAGERVLDAGCGTGDHAAAIAEHGAEVVGVDASPEMVERAAERFPGLDARVGDLRDLGPDGFDAVLSNAVLHWIPEADAAAASLAAALRPGGRLVAELGGRGNIAAIDGAARAARAEAGLPEAASPWYFPGIAEYAGVLERAGFEVTGAWLFDRPTRLEGEDGVAVWLRMFGSHLLEGVADTEAFLAGAQERTRGRLHRDGAWWADYRRLRVTAVKR